MGWFDSLGKFFSKPVGQAILGAGVGLGTSALGGLFGRGENKAATSAENSILQNFTNYRKDIQPYLNSLTGLAPFFQNATGATLAGSGKAYGQAMGTLGQANDYFTGLMNDPNKLAEVTASTASAQAQQAQAEREALSRMPGRTGAAAMLAGKSLGDVRRAGLANRLTAKNAAAQALPGIAQGYGQLGQGMGSLALGFGREIPQLYTGAGQLLTGGLQGLSGVAGVLNQNRQRSAEIGGTLTQFAQPIVKTFQDWLKNRGTTLKSGTYGQGWGEGPTQDESGGV